VCVCVCVGVLVLGCVGVRGNVPIVAIVGHTNAGKSTLLNRSDFMYKRSRKHAATHCNTLQHTATPCITLQYN